jgi:hypothetical protein
MPRLTSSRAEVAISPASLIFATLYAAGCLATQFKILPITETDVRLSLLDCEREHVAFVDRELGADE